MEVIMEDILFKGRKLNECTKEELIEIIKLLYLKNIQLLKKKKHECDFLMSLRRLK